MKATIKNGKAICPICGKEQNISAEDTYILCFHDELIEKKYDEVRVSLNPDDIEKEIKELEKNTDFFIEVGKRK